MYVPRADLRVLGHAPGDSQTMIFKTMVLIREPDGQELRFLIEQDHDSDLTLEAAYERYAQDREHRHAVAHPMADLSMTMGKRWLHSR